MYIDKLNSKAEITGYINDYAEGRLDPSEKIIFNDMMADNTYIAALAAKSLKGKRALNNAYSVVAADDFEEKLARRLARENQPEEGTAQASM